MRSRPLSSFSASVKRALRSGIARPTSGKVFERCVLHIGTEKTGTSSIQRFLAVNRDAFAAEGVVYPRSTGATGGSQWGFVACVHPKAWATDIGPFLGFDTEAGRDAYRDRFVAALDREFRTAHRATTLVVSCEHMQSRLIDTAQIGALADFLEPWVRDVEIVLYLRRQDRVSASLVSTQVKSGISEPVLFPTMPKGGLRYYYDYEKLYANWSTVFGRDAMRVGLYAPQDWRDGDLISDFCRLAGLEHVGKRMPEAMFNSSLDRVGTQFLQAVNRLLPAREGSGRNRERTDLANLVARLCPGRHVPATRHQAEEFYRHFIDSNERLKAVAFPDRDGPLFDDDFSDYPEVSEASAPSHAEAVELAIRLWRETRAPVARGRSLRRWFRRGP